MALVPSNYPKEPGASRCGDTYLKTINVTGAIPGTDFTGGFTKTILAVPIVGGSPEVPLFQSEADFKSAIERPGGIQKRLMTLSSMLLTEAPKDLASLLWLVDRARDLLQQAAGLAYQLEGTWVTDPVELQQLVIEALQHLRCAEYWTWRLHLLRQAKEVYKPELGLTAKLPTNGTEGEGALPPPPPPPPTTTATSKKTKSSNVGLIELGLGVVVATMIVLSKIRKG
jgi:hypothetical protein